MKINTLKRSRDFSFVATSGVKRYSSNFIFYCAYSEKGADSILVGFTASKRVGGAVSRNKAKRRMRVLFCEYVSANEALNAKGIAVTIIAKTTVVTEKWKTLKYDFEKTFATAIHNLEKTYEKKGIKIVT